MRVPKPSPAFSGSEWSVRSRDGGPGNGCWNASQDAVAVDEQGRVRLRLTRVDDRWCQAEVESRAFARYGRHRFHVISRLDRLHRSAVLGLFLYRDDSREIDIELAHTFGDEDDAGIYVIQPGTPDQRHSFPVELSGDHTSHEIDWQPGLVKFASWHGHHDAGPWGGWIERWEYRGTDVPSESDQLRVMMNLWLRGDDEPEEPQEVVLRYVAEQGIADGE